MGKPQTPHFHDFGIFERVPKPQNQLFYLWDTRTPKENQEKSLEPSKI